MRTGILISAGLIVTAAVLIAVQKDENPFPDGRLACAPLPPALARPDPIPLSPAALRGIVQIGMPAPQPGYTGAMVQIVEPEPGNERLASLRAIEASDWGIPMALESNTLVLASVPAARAVPAHPLVPSPSVIVPNLYLPEGALDDESAQLTLIRDDLAVYQEPAESSPAAPFKLQEGDRVRPLARIRSETDFDWLRFERDGRSWWAQAEYFIRVDPRNAMLEGVADLEIGREAVDRTSALPPDYRPTDLVRVSDELLLNSRDIMLRKEVFEAFQEMAAAAAKRGYKLRIFSGYRDFEHQKKLYLEAIATKGPKQNGTAAPGYSEHQLGTTVDLCNHDIRFILSGRFGETAEGRWLYENSGKFGFRQSYTSENTEEVGYKPEPWHFRYYGKPAQPSTGTAVAGR